MTPRGAGAWLLSCALGFPAMAHAQAPPEPGAVSASTGGAMGAAASVSSPPLDIDSIPAASQRNGREIYESFRAGLADPTCDAAATSARWKKHFGHAPGQLARVNDDLLPLFGYVVDALRDADLPTEFALIPFVESGYKPGARSAS
ncbi:MAG: hypothetical protein EOO78_26885, partial [Oxalobacteraceae bacterium]